MSYINPTGRGSYYPQKATYWPQKRQDGYGGENWDPPVIIDVRWEDYEEERLSVAYRAEGESVLSNAHVFTKVPLLEGGYLFKGESTEPNPSRLRVGNLKAYVIRKVSATPGLKGDYTENVAFL